MLPLKPPEMFKIKVTTSKRKKLFVKENSKEVYHKDKPWDTDMHGWEQSSHPGSDYTFESNKL